VLGIEATIKGVIIPFLGRVQLLSYNNTGNHIHLAVTAIRKKIIAGIESADPAGDDPKIGALVLARAGALRPDTSLHSLYSKTRGGKGALPRNEH
jgi:hypothetical protein